MLNGKQRKNVQIHCYVIRNESLLVRTQNLETQARWNTKQVEHTSKCWGGQSKDGTDNRNNGCRMRTSMYNWSGTSNEEVRRSKVKDIAKRGSQAEMVWICKEEMINNWSKTLDKDVRRSERQSCCKDKESKSKMVWPCNKEKWK